MIYRVQNFVTQFRGDTPGQVAIAKSKISMQLNHPPPALFEHQRTLPGGVVVPEGPAGDRRSPGVPRGRQPAWRPLPSGGMLPSTHVLDGAHFGAVEFFIPNKFEFPFALLFYVFFKFWRDAFFRIFVSLDRRFAFRLASYPP